MVSKGQTLIMILGRVGWAWKSQKNDNFCWNQEKMKKKNFCLQLLRQGLERKLRLLLSFSFKNFFIFLNSLIRILISSLITVLIHYWNEGMKQGTRSFIQQESCFEIFILNLFFRINKIVLWMIVNTKYGLRKIREMVTFYWPNPVFPKLF